MAYRTINATGIWSGNEKALNRFADAFAIVEREIATIAGKES